MELSEQDCVNVIFKISDSINGLELNDFKQVFECLANLFLDDKITYSELLGGHYSIEYKGKHFNVCRKESEHKMNPCLVTSEFVIGVRN